MSRKKKQRKGDVDDGRTVANMNVEGMPWYVDDKSTRGDSDGKTPSSGLDKITLSAKEKRAMMRGVLLAALLIAGLFFVVFAIFILFSIYVWFR